MPTCLGLEREEEEEENDDVEVYACSAIWVVQNWCGGLLWGFAGKCRIVLLLPQYVVNAECLAQVLQMPPNAGVNLSVDRGASVVLSE